MNWSNYRIAKLLFALMLINGGGTKGIAQTIVNPVFDRIDTQSFRVEKVEITKDTTFVYCSYSAEAGSWANISKDTHIVIHNTNKKLSLLKCIGLPFSPQQKIFNSAERCNVLLCFPVIPTKSKFDLIENASGKAFNIYGIDLNNQYTNAYQDSELKRFSNMASFYDSAGDTIKALQFKRKELEAAQYVYGIMSEPLMYTLGIASLIYYKYGFYEEAIKLANQEGEILVKISGTSSEDYTRYLCTLAMFYSNAKNYEKSISLYKKSISLFDSLNIIDDEYALTLRSISNNYYKIGDFENSLIYQQKCIDVKRAMGKADTYIEELFNTLIHPHGGKNDIISRIEIVEKELENHPTFIDINSPGILGLYKQIASKYSLIDDNKNAIEYCEKALAIMDGNKYNDNEDYAELLGLKCKYQQRSGLKDEAISSGTAAKQLYESLNTMSLKYAELLDDLACAYGLAMDYEKSIHLQTIAAGIYEKIKDWLSLAEAYNSISHYYQSAENLDDAEQNIKKAIDVLNEHDNAQQYINDEVELTGNNMINDPFALASIKERINTDKSNFHQTLARIYQKKGDLTNAINTELKNGAIIKSMGDDQLYVIHLMTLSQYYQSNQQLNEAIVCAEKSVQLLTNDNRISLALPKLQLAIICFQAGDTAKAIHYAEESVSASKSFDDKDGRIAAQSNLSYFYWKKRDYGKAEQCLSEELDYLRNFISNELKGMTTEQKQRLWSKYEHNFLLYRNIVEKSNRDDVLLSKLYNYVLFSKSLLLDADIQNDANRMKITWKDIQQQLSDEDIAIEFISTIEEEGNYYTYHALVLDKNNPNPKMITLYSETKLEEIKKTTTRNIRDVVGELIWEPIIAQYNNARSIYFSTDGILNILPIEYYNVNSITNMFEQYNMYRLTSTKEIIFDDQKKIKKNAVLYGGLDYELNEPSCNNENSNSLWRSINTRGGFEPLTNTYEEIQDIANLLKFQNVETDLYFGKHGTEDSFKNLSGKEVSMIHLSTHGMYVSPNNVIQKKKENNFDFIEIINNERDPVKEDIVLTHSFLVMSGGNKLTRHETIEPGINDGILTAFEISQLDLSKLDLVVLSACETGLGDLDNGGVYGLQRGFKKAGANTILMSLDKVDDEATKLLMVEFYKNLMSGKTKQQSLKDAQHYLRKVENGKYDNPKYWTSFIMLDGLN